MADHPNAPRYAEGVPPHLITSKVYEAMWEVYRDGIRSAGELMSKFGVSRPTARKAINLGWPERGFMPLKTRARDHDQLKVEAERQAALDKHKEATDAWYKAGKQFNRVADNAVTFCILALQQISQLATARDADGNLRLKPLTKHVRRRTIDPETGKARYWDEEVPLTTQEAVKLQQPVLKAAAAASMFKRVWPVTTDEQKASVGPPQGLAALSLEQLDTIVNEHQLPPGVSAEDVFGVDIPGFAKKPGVRGN